MNQSPGLHTNKSGYVSSRYYLFVVYPLMVAGITAFLVGEGSNDGAGLHPSGGCSFIYQSGQQLLHALNIHNFFAKLCKTVNSNFENLIMVVPVLKLE